MRLRSETWGTCGALGFSLLAFSLINLFCVTSNADETQTKYQRRYKRMDRQSREQQLRARSKRIELAPAERKIARIQSQMDANYAASRRTRDRFEQNRLSNERVSISVSLSNARQEKYAIERKYQQMRNNDYRQRWEYRRRGIGVPVEVPDYAKQWRWNGQSYEWRPWARDVKQAAKNNAAAYERAQTNFANNWNPDAKKFTENWVDWIDSTIETMKAWPEKQENILKTEREPIVEVRGRLAYQRFYKKLSQNVDNWEKQVRAEDSFRTNFVKNEIEPLKNEILNEGAPTSEFSSHLSFISTLESDRQSQLQTSILNAWTGVPKGTGIKAEWDDFDLKDILKELHKKFAPYAPLKLEYQTESSKLSAALEEEHTPWLAMHHTELKRWMTEQDDALSDIGRKHPHVREDVKTGIKKEQADRDSFRKWVDEQQAAQKKVYDTVEDELDVLLGAAMDKGTSPDKVERTLEVEWKKKTSTWAATYQTWKNAWEGTKGKPGEKARRDRYPGADVLVKTELGRYPIEIQPKDCQHEYHRALDGDITSLRFVGADGKKDVVLFEIQGKRSWACVGEESLFIAESFVKRDLSIAESAKATWEKAETGSKSGIAVFVRGNILISVSAIPFDGVTMAKAGVGKDTGRLGVLFHNTKGQIVSEFSFLLTKKDGVAEFSKAPNLRFAVEEIWDRERRLAFEKTYGKN